jgi:hypothetical protein
MSHETGITTQPSGLPDDGGGPPETPEEEGARRKRRRRRQREEAGRTCSVSGCCEDDFLTTLIRWDAGCEGACCCLQLLHCC